MRGLTQFLSFYMLNVLKEIYIFFFLHFVNTEIVYFTIYYFCGFITGTGSTIGLLKETMGLFQCQWYNSDTTRIWMNILHYSTQNLRKEYSLYKKITTEIIFYKLLVPQHEVGLHICRDIFVSQNCVCHCIYVPNMHKHMPSCHAYKP